ncbi:unnamed protein product [Arabidopsis halleri]
MFSGAGGGENRRRRDLVILLCFLCSFVMRFLFSVPFFLLQPSPKPSRTISLSMASNGDSNSSDGGQRWGPAFALPSHPLFAQSPPKPPVSSDASQTTESSRIAQPSTFRSGSDSFPPEEPSHRTSLMAGDLSLGPSDAPCPVEASTAHGDVTFWGGIPYLFDRVSSIKAPTTIFVSDLASPVRSCRNSCQPFNSKKRQSTGGKTLTACLDPHFELGWTASGPLRNLPRPKTNANGLTHLPIWPRSVFLSSLSKTRYLMSRYGFEIGRGLLSLITLTTIYSLDKELLLTLLVDFSALESSSYRSSMSKNLMIESSSFIERTFESSSFLERTFDWSPTLSLRNHLDTLTTFVEATCFEPVISKVKDSFSTSLCLVWTVTIQQSPDVFVELSSTHHSFACGKLLPCSCLRCMDLPSNYSIPFLYHSLVRELVVFFDVSNHEVDVCLNFVLPMG